MTTVKTILETYERTGSYRRTAREVGVAHNTVRKYVLRAQAAREGTVEEIVPRDREIHQPSRVVTPEIRELIHRILERNRQKAKKQRCTAKLIWRHLLASGSSLSYSTVKREVARWHAERGYREVFIAQETDEGQRAEFDFGKVRLTLDGVPGTTPLASIVLNHSLYRFSLLTGSSLFHVGNSGMISSLRSVPGMPCSDALHIRAYRSTPSSGSRRP